MFFDGNATPPAATTDGTLSQEVDKMVASASQIVKGKNNSLVDSVSLKEEEYNTKYSSVAKCHQKTEE